jgi:hypothetical protein
VPDRIDHFLFHLVVLFLSLVLLLFPRVIFLLLLLLRHLTPIIVRVRVPSALTLRPVPPPQIVLLVLPPAARGEREHHYLPRPPQHVRKLGAVRVGPAGADFSGGKNAGATTTTTTRVCGVGDEDVFEDLGLEVEVVVGE